MPADTHTPDTYSADTHSGGGYTVDAYTAGVYVPGAHDHLPGASGHRAGGAMSDGAPYQDAAGGGRATDRDVRISPVRDSFDAAWPDGAEGGKIPPGGYTYPARPDRDGDGPVGRAVKMASRIRTFEGLRGYSARTTEVARHVFYFLALCACVSVTHWAFASSRAWKLGGLIMLYAVTVMLAVAAVGSVLYADQRHQITEQYRHFVFGIVVLPGTGVALFMRLVGTVLDNPNAQADSFAQVIAGNGLPLLFLAIVTIPPVVFLKYVFGGLRTQNRSAMSDEEQMSTWMRQDSLQR